MNTGLERLGTGQLDAASGSVPEPQVAMGDSAKKLPPLLERFLAR
jgi:hypothetical protein